MRRISKTSRQTRRWILAASFCLTLQTGYPQLLVLAQPDHSQPLQQPLPQVSLRAALLSLMEQKQADIIFDERLLVEKQVPKQRVAASQPIEKTLSDLLEGTGLRFRKIRRNSYLILARTDERKVPARKTSATSEPLPNSGRSESNATSPAVSPVTPLELPDRKPTLTVSGTVTDESGAALPGVSVLVKGTQTGTTTDQEGTYRLNVDGPSAVLVFSFVGYESKEITVGNRTLINVLLNPDLKSLDEVVVGYGTQKKENLTGAVSAISGENLIQRPVTTTSQALQGMAPGVTVSQNFGVPGKNTSTIRIRGIGTLGNNNPLVLIDNIEGSLNDIDPNTIESISVLKDAASASIYGSRAANGVILVTTKRGTRKDKFSITYRGYAGVQTPTNLPELVGALDYLTLTNESRTNEGKAAVFTKAFVDDYAANVGTSEKYPDTNWYDAAMKRSAFQQQHTLGINGGGEKMSAQATFTFQDQKGLLDNTGYKRYGLRLNTDFQIDSRLRLGVDLFATQGKQNEPSGVGVSQNGVNEIFRMINEVPPLYPVKLESGSWGVGWNGANPLAMTQVGGVDNTNSSRVQLNLNATYRFAEFLKLDVIYAPKYLSEWETNFVKQYPFEILGGTPQVYPAKNQFSEAYNRTFENNARGVLSFNKRFGVHGIQALAGIEYITNRYDHFNAYRENFALQNFEVLNAGSDVNKDNAGSSSEWALFSNFARLNYSLSDKYLFEANVRYDGSSRFTQGNKFGVFPSFSAGWRISEENFLKSVTPVDNIKLRASWGQLGNQNIGNYPFASVISFSGQNYSFNNKVANGAALLDLANSGISWETTEMVNLGLDFGFFRNKLTGSFDYYVKNTKDILLLLPIPLSTGLNPAYRNAGWVQNKGWDLMIGHQNKVGRFSYNANFILSDVKNKVTDLEGAGPFIDGRTVIQEGQEINSFYGYKSDGLFQTADEVKNAATQFGNVAPGDIKYVDVNNDGTVNSADRQIIGSSIPRYTFSVNTGFTYGSIDLTVFLQGVGKNSGYVYRNQNISYSGTFYTWELDRWTPQTPNASHPRTISVEPNNLQTTDFYLRNAAYLRVKTLQLGFTLPQAWATKMALNKVRLFFTGDNLFTFTPYYRGFDPEAPSGAGHFYYPNTKVLVAGVDIKF